MSLELMPVDVAIRYLNSHPMIGAQRFVKQQDDAPLGFGGWFFRVFPFDELGVHFVEARIDDRSRWVGCPNPPDAYLIHNNGKYTRFGKWDYGRAARYFAALVKARSDTQRKRLNLTAQKLGEVFATQTADIAPER